MDGNDITCRNNIKYIGMASGKTSTYLQCGLPLLINKIGELSNRVVESRLGVIADSFSDIPGILSSLTRNDLNSLRANCIDFFSRRLDLDTTIKPLLNVINGIVQKQNTEANAAETNCHAQHAGTYLVSAIVSTYNAERFIRGKLEDLEAQSIADRLEIIVIDSGSQQNERAIVAEFQKRYTNIRYIRTPERETLYAAWNRGVSAAKGSYITNSNTDDRHRPDALEVMATALDQLPQVDLVYGDCHVSTIPNETYEKNPKTRLFRYPDFFAPAVLLHYQFGPQPMWRRSVHDKVGYFDSSFRAAGDYDFNIRFALQCRALHIPESLGLYLEHDGAISFKDDTMARENSRIAVRYRTLPFVERLYRQAGVPAVTTDERARVFLDMGVRSLEYYPPWETGVSETNVAFAITCFEKAVELLPDLPASRNNLANAYWHAGEKDRALRVLAAAPGKESEPVLRATIAALTGKGGGTARLIPSGLPFPSQHELAMGRKSGRTPDNDNSPLTICMVASIGPIAPTGSAGGLETAIRQTAAALAARGHRVAIVGYLRGNPGRHEGVEYLPIEEWSRGDYPAFSEETDILAFASGPDLGSYRKVGQRTGKAVLFHHQQLSFLTGKDPLAVLNQEADVAICVSNAVRENLIRDGVNREKLEVVPNGVDPGVFYPRSVSREPHRILFAGALVPDKNVHLLIEAFLKISPGFPDAELHICGSASLWGAAEYIDRDAVQRLSPKVIFHGTVSRDELAVHYSRATLCVIPSRFESFSLVSLEAQACGCVPLVADVGGAPETILPGETGFVYHTNNADVLADTLTTLLGNPEALEAAGRSAADFVARQFSWDRTAAQYERVFHNIAAARTGKTPVVRDSSTFLTVPRVSVVIPCYNYARYLPEAVGSVLAQTFRDFEIIIVNDGSTDNTLEVAKKLMSACTDGRIRLINQANSGDPALARNSGIREAYGEFILCLDADNLIMQEFLHQCATLLNNEPDIAIAYTDQIYFGSGKELVVRVADYEINRLAKANFMGYCSLFRKKVWEEVGGYSRGIGYEDWDFWLSCGEKGHYGRRIPQPLFCYRQHDSGRYMLDKGRDAEIKARIVLKHPALYGRRARAEADGPLHKRGRENDKHVRQAFPGNRPDLGTQRGGRDLPRHRRSCQPGNRGLPHKPLLHG